MACTNYHWWLLAVFLTLCVSLIIMGIATPNAGMAGPDPENMKYYDPSNIELEPNFWDPLKEEFGADEKGTELRRALYHGNQDWEGTPSDAGYLYKVVYTVDADGNIHGKDYKYLVSSKPGTLMSASNTTKLDEILHERWNAAKQEYITRESVRKTLPFDNNLYNKDLAEYKQGSVTVGKILAGVPLVGLGIRSIYREYNKQTNNTLMYLFSFLMVVSGVLGLAALSPNLGYLYLVSIVCGSLALTGMSIADHCRSPEESKMMIQQPKHQLNRRQSVVLNDLVPESGQDDAIIIEKGIELNQPELGPNGTILIETSH